VTSFVLAFALIFSAAACTGGSSPTGTPAHGTPSLFLPSTGSSASGSGEPSSTGSGKPPIVLPVVATTSGPLAAEDQGYLDGMRLAVQEIDQDGGVKGRALALDFYDDGGDPDQATQAIDEALDQKPVAILYVGPGEAVIPLRPRLEQKGTPLILLSGDLYSSRGLFPQVFQTTIPWEWQANVIARYLVLDRKAGRTVFVGAGADATVAAGATAAAMAYWGGKLAATVTTGAGGSVDAARAKAKGAAAVIAYGATPDLGRVVQSLAGLRKPPRIAGPASLLSSAPRPPPGTVACYTYTWAGWSQPIPRVGVFRTAFATMTGRGATGMEQEGYEAVRLLSWGLRRTGAAGGTELVGQFEQAKGLLFSSFPIDLGPDDHVLPPRDQLGLFAVAGRDEKVDAWQIHGTEPWRAVMRTFTYDGQRTSVLDVDRTVFFPWWTKYLPGPHYWRSIYGIATRPKDDPLH
jgi:ABC-type branched-subunit amino acid transport system substrate-binding protein